MAKVISALRVPGSRPTRLLFSFGLICILLAGLGSFLSLGLRSLQHLDSAERSTAVRQIGVLRAAADDTVLLQAEVLRHVAETAPQEMASSEDLIARLRKSNEQRLKIYRTSDLTPYERQLYTEVNRARRDYDNQTDRILAFSRTSRNSELLELATARQAPAYNLYQSSLGELIRGEEYEARELAEEGSNRIERMRRGSDILIGLAVLIAVVAVGNIYQVVRSLRNDRNRLAEEVARHRQTDEALSESKEQLRLLLDRIPDAVYVVCEGLIVFANPAAQKLFGSASRPSLVGREVRDFVPPEDQAGFEERAREIATRTVPVATERRLLRLDGVVIDVETNSMPTIFEGKPAIQVITRDIAERKSSEQMLRAQEKQYRLLFEDSPTPMWVYDPETLAFLAVNRAALKHYGYSRDEFLRRTLLDIRPEQETAALAKAASSDPDAPAHCAGTWQHLTKDGRILAVEIHTCPIVFDGRKARLTTAYDITGRAESERKIRESEASLSLAQHVAGVGSWEYEMGPNGRLDHKLCWSAEVYHLFGRTPATFTPSTSAFFQAVHPDDREAVVQAFRDFDATGNRLSIDLRIILPDQSERTVHMAAEAIREKADGKRRKVIGIVMDITARVAAAKALRKAEEKYRTIFANASEGIFQSTPEGRFIDVNPAAARIFGFATPEEMMAERSDISRQSYVDPQRRIDFIHQVEAAGIVNGFECEVNRKDGSTVWLSENARAVRDPNGRTLYYEGTFQDITQRKDALRQLREQADLLDLAHDAIMVRDMDDRVQFWNRGAERLYGWTAEEVLGRKISEFLTNLDPAVRRAAHQIFLETGEWSGEKKDRNKKGETVIVHSRWSLVRDQFGRPKSKLVINTDITRQKTTRGPASAHPAPGKCRHSRQRHRARSQQRPAPHSDGRAHSARRTRSHRAFQIPRHRRSQRATRGQHRQAGRHFRPRSRRRARPPATGLFD